MSALRIQNLEKSYRLGSSAEAVRALVGVSLEVDEAEFVALHGASGSGKSTLLYTLAGLVTPDAGEIHLDGKDLTGMRSADRTRHRLGAIGLVFQDFRLIPYLDVLGNVMLTSSDHEAALGLLDRMQLSHRVHHKPSQLSAGEQQRCAVARALVHRPRLVLADEPTGNLDAKNSAIILDYLADYASQGNIVIMATHDPEAVSTASRGVGLEVGSIQA